MTLIKIFFLYAHVQCMSELSCKFQMPASHTAGGVSEIRTVLQRVTDRRMEVQTDKSKTICTSSLHDGGIIKQHIKTTI